MSFSPPLTSNHYSMTETSISFTFCCVLVSTIYYLCLEYSRCSTNVCQMHQWMTFLNKLQPVDTCSLSLKASSHFHLANSCSSLKTQFSCLGLWEAFPDSVRECSCGTCYVWTAVGPLCPPTKAVRSLRGRAALFSPFGIWNSKPSRA